MRNLHVLRLAVSDANPKLQNATSSTVCPGRDAGVIVIANGSLFHVNGESHKIVLELSLVENGYLHDDGSDNVVGLEYVTEHDAVCVATSSGDVLLCTPSTQKLECMGCVDSGLQCMSWSPDQEVVVFITGSNTLILMSKDFDPLLESPLHTDEFGKGAFVNVGWGKKETQFHGTEGKPGMRTKATTEQKLSKALPWDDHLPRVSWRGDGQFFVCSTVHAKTGTRQLLVYNREGIHQSTSETVDGLEQALNWKPSGSLIASTQRKPHKHDVIFFEKNGLRHGEFTLPCDRDEMQVKEIQWNADSSILALWMGRLHSKSDGDATSCKSIVQMWCIGNYHWYLKQEFPLPHGELTGVIWDPELPYRIHFLTSDGRYIWVDFTWAIDQSKGHCETNNATVAVVDGAKILLTPFRHQVVPPPMASQTLVLSCPVNQIAFSPPPRCDDMIILTSDNTLTLFKQSNSHEGVKQSGPNGFRAFTLSVYPVATTSLNACLPSWYHFLRHLIWWTSDSLLAVVWQPDSGSDCIMEFSLQIEEPTEMLTVSLRHQCQVEMPVLQLESNSDTKTVVVEFTDGSVMVYNSDQKSDHVPCISPWTTKLGQEVSFPLPCARIETAVVSDEEIVLGLSDWARFYVNGKEVVRDCTSFAVHDEFILLTTHSHACRFIPLLCSLENLTSVFHDDTSGLLSESIRRVERGSRIVTVVPGDSKLILQMPRGNLETICPRALLLSYVRKEIDRLEYGRAFQAMRKHRINMNLLYDHNPSQFLESLDLVIHQLKSANSVNLFLSYLKDEDVTKSTYPGWSVIQPRQNDVVGKVDRVCDSMRSRLEAADHNKFMLSILMTHVKKTKPELEEALVKIQRLRDHPPQCGCISATDALNFLIVLVDVNQLYDVALGTYDLNLVLMVAEKSQKDPKEYLPFLNRLRPMGDHEKYQIDCHLKRYMLALQHISKCGPEMFEECLDLVKNQCLYTTALQLFEQSTTQCKAIAKAYGEHLVERDQLEEAGIVLFRYGHLEAALTMFEKCGSWQIAFAVAFQLQLQPPEILRLARSLSDNLKGRQKYGEAARILCEYASDPEEAIVCLIAGSLWEDCLRLIHTHGRVDLVETHLRPALLEATSSSITDTDSWREQFDQYRNRLVVVREEKALAKERLQAGDSREDCVITESDLYSDAGSVTGQSHRSSSYSKSTARSSKNRRKAERKKYQLKEGSPFEETALLEALGDLWTAAHGIRRDIGRLVRVLLLHGCDVEASALQRTLCDCLDHMDSYKEQIWSQNTQTVETGPWMTSNDIAAASRTFVAARSQDAYTKPHTETIEWKLSLLQN